jgi:hypothetical protein
VAGITTVDEANRFLREHYIAELNRKFAVPAREKGTAFRKSSRSDLHWVFTLQTERVVEKDNTVAIGERRWQVERTRFRHSLAGTTVTIHEHLDGTVSIRYGPHVVGRFTADGNPMAGSRSRRKEGRGKGGPVEAVENRKAVSHPSHRPLEILPRQDSHFPTAPATTSTNGLKTRKPPSASRRGSSGGIY